MKLKYIFFFVLMFFILYVISCIAPFAVDDYDDNNSESSAAGSSVFSNSSSSDSASSSGNFDVVFTINSNLEVKTISDKIYGINYFDADAWSTAPYKFGRLGGNRWTAYNWENNASNAGSDWYYQNDGYLGGGDTPGEAVRGNAAFMIDSGAQVLITIPIIDYAAADKNGDGDIRNSANYLTTRLRSNQAVKGSAFSLTPDLTDGYVYQDEFINFIRNRFSNFNNISVSLDNEPDLWSDTHAETHPEAVTYDELCTRSINYAKAVKNAAPEAEVFGFVSYGFNGFINLQDASDSGANGEFIDYFLSRMNTAGTAAGKRLIDVLDLHWYSEVYVGGVRITEDAASGSAYRDARMQAPRTLWDTGCHENSWVDDWCVYGWGGSISLIPHLKTKIAYNYPGTKIAFTEYNYGGGNDISGAIAQADVLGIFGREGVYAATLWPMNEDNSFLYGAFNAFLNYDGAGARFGTAGISAATSDYAMTSVYASTAGTGKVVIIALNKTTGYRVADIQVTHSAALNTGRIFTIESTHKTPQLKGSVSGITGNRVAYTMPPLSISVIELSQ